MGNITKDSIDGMMTTIQNLYLSDSIPWMIGYSGGKDSTAAVQLVWMAIEALPQEQRKKTVHIMNTDTLVESPVVAQWVERSLDAMQEAAEERGLPFVPVRLPPDWNDTFWVNLIGRGYPFPHEIPLVHGPSEGAPRQQFHTEQDRGAWRGHFGARHAQAGECTPQPHDDEPREKARA